MPSTPTLFNDNGFHSIKLKMCLILLPAILIGLIVITGVAAYSSYSDISELSTSSMQQTLKTNSAEIHEMLNQMEIACNHMAYNAGYDYKDESEEDLAKDIVDELDEQSLANGGGLWFEPYAYRADKELVCPFTFRENGKLKTDFNYVQESGSYLQEDWYTGGKNASKGKPFLTAPYFDAAAKTVMVTFASPITAETEGGGERTIGVATVDISLKQIADIIDNIKVGETGHAYLVTDKGVYIAGVPQDQLEKGANATEEQNASLAAAMKEAITKDSGVTSYKDDNGETQVLTYATMKDTGWSLVLVQSQSELYAGARGLVWRLIAIAVIVLVLLMLAAYRTIASYVTRIAVNQKFAEDLAQGNYAREGNQPKSNDEIGLLGRAMNEMFETTRVERRRPGLRLRRRRQHHEPAAVRRGQRPPRSRQPLPAEKITRDEPNSSARAGISFDACAGAAVSMFLLRSKNQYSRSSTLSSILKACASSGNVPFLTASS